MRRSLPPAHVFERAPRPQWIRRIAAGIARRGRACSVWLANRGAAAFVRARASAIVTAMFDANLSIDSHMLSWRFDSAKLDRIRLGNRPGMASPEALTIDSIDLRFGLGGQFGRRSVKLIGNRFLALRGIGPEFEAGSEDFRVRRVAWRCF